MRTYLDYERQVDPLQRPRQVRAIVYVPSNERGQAGAVGASLAAHAVALDLSPAGAD